MNTNNRHNQDEGSDTEEEECSNTEVDGDATDPNEEKIRAVASTVASAAAAVSTAMSAAGPAPAAATGDGDGNTGSGNAGGGRNSGRGGTIVTASGKYVLKLGPHDVLLGRGTGPNNNNGNVEFRTTVERCKDEYVATSSRKAKSAIVRNAVNSVKGKNGRFLSKLSRNELKMRRIPHKVAYEIAPDSIAIEKVKQALRYVCYKKEETKIDTKGARSKRKRESSTASQQRPNPTQTQQQQQQQQQRGTSHDSSDEEEDHHEQQHSISSKESQPKLPQHSILMQGAKNLLAHQTARMLSSEMGPITMIKSQKVASQPEGRTSAQQQLPTSGRRASRTNDVANSGLGGTNHHAGTAGNIGTAGTTHGVPEHVYVRYKGESTSMQDTEIPNDASQRDARIPGQASVEPGAGGVLNHAGQTRLALSATGQPRTALPTTVGAATAASLGGVMPASDLGIGTPGQLSLPLFSSPIAHTGTALDSLLIAASQQTALMQALQSLNAINPQAQMQAQAGVSAQAQAQAQAQAHFQMQMQAQAQAQPSTPAPGLSAIHQHQLLSSQIHTNPTDMLNNAISSSPAATAAAAAGGGIDAASQTLHQQQLIARLLESSGFPVPAGMLAAPPAMTTTAPAPATTPTSMPAPAPVTRSASTTTSTTPTGLAGSVVPQGTPALPLSFHPQQAAMMQYMGQDQDNTRARALLSLLSILNSNNINNTGGSTSNTNAAAAPSANTERNE